MVDPVANERRRDDVSVEHVLRVLAHSGKENRFDADFGWRDHDDDLDRAVVVTAETEPDFSSGSAAWTPDEGHHWFTLPNVSGYWAVAFADPHHGWFVGNNGQILKISF